MKSKKKLFMLLLGAFLCCSNSCKKKEPEIPVQTYMGEIIKFGCLSTVSGYYHLTLNNIPVGNNMIVDNIEYSVGDIVKVTGYLKPMPESNNDFNLEIKTIKKWYPGQDTQRFLGEYRLDGICRQLYYLTTTFKDPITITVTITEGIESDLILTEGPEYPNFKVFIVDDSFFIPGADWYWEVGSYFFNGDGNIKNDSLFMHYIIAHTTSGGTSGGTIECKCKGKKID